MIDDLAFALASLFAVFNPIALSIYFLMLSEGKSEKRRSTMAIRATIIAMAIAVAAVLFGTEFLDFMGIRLGSFSIAGGMILIIFGTTKSLGLSFGLGDKEADPTGTPLASPLMAGPGMISMSMLLSQQIGTQITLVAIAVMMILGLTAMIFSSNIKNMLGRGGVQMMSRILGLILVAVSIQLIATGLLTS